MASRPDMIIGIDVGTTCTGVAYANLDGPDPEVRIFNNWEDRTIADKVPTHLVYDNCNINHGPIAWGFSSQNKLTSTKDTVSAHWFKQDFAPESELETSDDNSPDSTLPPVDTLYEHFLSQLYEHIKDFLNTELSRSSSKNWESASINFLFSVPATWNPERRGHFRDIAVKAGFGSHPNHSVAASLTEPQAAIIFTINEDELQLKNGNNVLIVDSGGGTTDLCLVRVDVPEKNRPSLSELKPVDGINVGSTCIDDGFVELVREELEAIGHEKLGHPSSMLPMLAWRTAMSEQFQLQKRTLDGNTHAESSFPVKVHGLGKKDTFDQSNIKEGRLHIKQGQLMQMFDDQIKDIEEKIMDVVNHMAVKQLGQLDYIILSGGLGSSKYVHKKLVDRYTNQQSLSNVLRDVIIHQSSSPQLCVCQGLVYERIHKVYHGSSTFTQLRSQFSFGIIKDEEFNSRNSYHKETKKQKRFRNIFGGKERWVGNCVDWLVRSVCVQLLKTERSAYISQGDVVSPGQVIPRTLHHKFERGVPKSNLRGLITVVRSLASGPAPYFAPNNGVEKYDALCCDYSGLDVRFKPWYDLTRDYQQVDFKIEATFGVDEVIFECLSLDSTPKKLSEKPVTVQAKVEVQEQYYPPSVLYSK
ncbi:hypothetical protein F4821DRAFT_105987 [Hypoxylon rubiginosum]|uniref:Uncharacterized protein n=1 Tax=Hypoxylon rubiginosum TaxID=110542 RepID=A0ACC0D468_9PEZI|nr:hypothetical protein F4821DRAFT_105987 [Hypoxylon rubiginosum]